MTGVRSRLKAWLGVRPDAASQDPVAPISATKTPGAAEAGLFRLAAGLDDGAPCSPALLAALAELMTSRRVEAEVDDGPPSPRLSELRIRRSGVPDWWTEGENLLLVGLGSGVPELRANPHVTPPRHSILALGARSHFNHIHFGRDGALVVLGDGVTAHAGAMSCIGRSSVLIGDGTTCTNWAMLDCRNGGMILVGADGMWAHAVSLMTDDTHAIRDAQTGRRLNTYGGRIVVGRHVWLCEQARLLDGARVGADAVVGSGALVKAGAVPANTVVVGVPARPVRSGITWSREDTP